MRTPNTNSRFSNLPQPEINLQSPEVEIKTGGRFGPGGPFGSPDKNLSVQNQMARSFDLNPQPLVPQPPDITIDGDAAFVASNEIFVRNTQNVNEAADAPIIDNDTMETRILERGEIRKQDRDDFINIT